MKTSEKLVLVVISCFIQLIPVFCASDELLDSWKKINENYNNDIQQSNKIFYKIKEEQRRLSELRTIVERHLRTKNAEIIINALNSYNYSTTANGLQDILKQFDQMYDNRMIDNILFAAIEEIIQTNDVLKIPHLLWTIYQQNDNRSFAMMLRAQIQLYNSLSLNQHPDKNDFLHSFANILYKIKRESLYNGIGLSLKLKVQNIIEQLPFNLKYLYFMPYFCLENTKYSTYIYTAIEMKIDPLSRYIWLWRDTRSMDDTGYIKAEISEVNEDNDGKVYVALKGTKYHMYYYMMPNTMTIAGWDSLDSPLHHIWGIEFLDNERVVFIQNDYLMCATDSHDNDRRNVAGLQRGQVSTLSPECQWRLGQCSF